MTISNPKKHYSRFLKSLEGKLHFAAHSHHFWPDVSRDAQLQCWDDAATLSDEKWNPIFGEVIPGVQKHIARILNLKDPEQIAFAPNTHELSVRLLSLFLGRKNLDVLTTGSEFHSWKRQILKLEELPDFKVEMISTDKLLHNRSAFLEELKAGLDKAPDIFFISQVFFDSGLTLSMEELSDLAHYKNEKTIMVIDGYHGFCAVPTDLSLLEGKVFYLAGGYKYAQAGEGVGFMVVPKGDHRPFYTGWFAEYGDLSQPPGTNVGFTQNGLAFMGATQDPSGFYRFNAVWNHFEREGYSVKEIHQYVQKLQREFIQGLPESFLSAWELKPLFHPEVTVHGHFLTYEALSIQSAEKCQAELKSKGIYVDRRGTRIRFGFGLYQDSMDVSALIDRLNQMAKKSP